MRRVLSVLLAGMLLLLGASPSAPALAQGGETAGSAPDLLLFTEFPSQVIGVGDVVTLELSLRSEATAQIVDLDVQDMPEGWAASFRGSGRIVQSVFVQPEEDTSVDLRVEPPAEVESGTYRFTVVARGDGVESELPITLTVEERAPASLSFEVDLPTVRGRPDTTFRYNVTLRNEGDENLNVDLLPQAPPAFRVTIKSAGQEVTTIPLEADESERLSIEVEPLLRIIPADDYPITIRAQGGEASASVELTAQVVGQSSLNLTTPDERLSGEIEAGSTSTVTLLVQNTGSAAAQGIDMSASSPSGWTVEFDPEEIGEIGPGEQQEVTVNVRPADKALAGDYMLTFRARPEEGTTESLEYRVTVRTSTLWGIVGIVLIAVAVGVVALAVARFGRR